MNGKTWTWKLNDFRVHTGRVFVASVSRLIFHKPFSSLAYLKIYNRVVVGPLISYKSFPHFWLNGWLDFYLDVFRFAFHSHSFSYSCMLNIFHRSKVSEMKRKKLRELIVSPLKAHTLKFFCVLNATFARHAAKKLCCLVAVTNWQSCRREKNCRRFATFRANEKHQHIRLLGQTQLLIHTLFTSSSIACTVYRSTFFWICRAHVKLAAGW